MMTMLTVMTIAVTMTKMRVTIAVAMHGRMCVYANPSLFKYSKQRSFASTLRCIEWRQSSVDYRMKPKKHQLRIPHGQTCCSTCLPGFLLVVASFEIATIITKSLEIVTEQCSKICIYWPPKLVFLDTR